MTIKNFDIQLYNVEYLMMVDEKQYSLEIDSNPDGSFLCTLWERSDNGKYIDMREEFIINIDGGIVDRISEISELALKRMVFPDFYSYLKFTESVDD